MEKVLGIGGLFFRARDPQALARWYAERLGVTEMPQDYESAAWRQSGGTTVFAPFDEASDYFGDPDKRFMVNFRVRDLDAMVTQLLSADVAVTVDRETYPNGRFARLVDPEGNPIELWEPAGVARDTEEG